MIAILGSGPKPHQAPAASGDSSSTGSFGFWCVTVPEFQAQKSPAATGLIR